MATKTKTLKIGQKVKIVENKGTFHNFQIGEECKIVLVDIDDRVHPYLVSNTEGMPQWVCRDDFKLIK